MKRIYVAAGAAAIALLGLTSYFSPYWDLHQMKTAVENRDAERFSAKVDFPALRESIKAQMGLALDKELAGASDKPLAGLGQMMANALLGPIVEAAVSPAGVMRMFQSGSARPVLKRDEGDPEAPGRDQRPDYSVAYRSWDTVSVTKAGGESGAFILKRAGLWSWKLAAIEL